MAKPADCSPKAHTENLALAFFPLRPLRERCAQLDPLRPGTRIDLAVTTAYNGDLTRALTNASHAQRSPANSTQSTEVAR